MPQDFGLKINGQEVNVLSGRFFKSMETAADFMSAEIVVNPETEAELYNALKPYRATPFTLDILGTPKLTGQITAVTPNVSESGTTYAIEGYSLTYNFIDSAVQPPYEFTAQNVETIIQTIAAQTGTPVVIEAQPPSPIYQRATANIGESCFEFANRYARPQLRIITSNEQGALLIQTPNTAGAPIGVIEQGSPNSILAQQFSAKFDLRKRFKTYKIITNSPFGISTAVSVDPNLQAPRFKRVSVTEITAGSAARAAQIEINRGITEALTISLPITDWKFQDGTLIEPNNILTVKSPALFIPDGFNFFIKSVEYEFSEGGKAGTLNLVPPQVYTAEPIVEPWFVE